MNTINVFDAKSGCMLTFGPPLEYGNPAILLWQGRRLKEFLALDDWKEHFAKSPSPFQCAFCSEPVVGFSVPENCSAFLALCRCTYVYFFDCPPFSSQQQWTRWQSQYLHEMADPAPFDALREGVHSGKLSGSASDWISRRIDAPEGLTFHLNGAISAGEASVSLSPTSLLATVGTGNKADSDKICALLRKLRDNSLEPPERIVITGRDPDYVWPFGTDISKAVRLPFRCVDCKAWIKQAPIGWPAHDRVLGCFCHVIVFRTDIAQPANYRQWRELLTSDKTERLRHETRQPPSGNN